MEMRTVGHRQIDSSTLSLLHFTDVIPRFSKVAAVVLGIIMLIVGGLTALFTIVLIGTVQDNVGNIYLRSTTLSQSQYDILQKFGFPYLVSLFSVL